MQQNPNQKCTSNGKNSESVHVTAGSTWEKSAGIKRRAGRQAQHSTAMFIGSFMEHNRSRNMFFQTFCSHSRLQRLQICSGVPGLSLYSSVSGLQSSS